MAIPANTPGAAVTVTPNNLLVTSLLLEETVFGVGKMRGSFGRYGTLSNAGSNPPAVALGLPVSFVVTEDVAGAAFLSAVQGLVRTWLTGSGKLIPASGQSIVIKRLLMTGHADASLGLVGTVTLNVYLTAGTPPIKVLSSNTPTVSIGNVYALAASDPTTATALSTLLEAVAAFNASKKVV